jgi:hypothetical protein
MLRPEGIESLIPTLIKEPLYFGIGERFLTPARLKTFEIVAWGLTGTDCGLCTWLFRSLRQNCSLRNENRTRGDQPRWST